jgi:hypothetical protein
MKGKTWLIKKLVLDSAYEVEMFGRKGRRIFNGNFELRFCIPAMCPVPVVTVHQDVTICDLGYVTIQVSTCVLGGT